MSTYQIADDNTQVRFNYSCPISLTSKEARVSLRDKWKTKQLLGRANVPVPRGVRLDATVASTDDLALAAEEVGYPMAIKPTTGSKGEGVHTGINSWDELQKTYAHVVHSLRPREILIETSVVGDDYRILVLGDRVLAACRRIPANVVGNGRNTIAQLIEAKNDTRRANPFLSRGLIAVDFEVQNLLDQLGYTLSSVLPEGQTVALRRVANASAGGDVLDVTAEIPQSLRDAAVAAVAAVPDLVIAGVDFLYTPATTSTPERFSVIEMNYRPHIGVNMYPTGGEGQEVPRDIIDYLFPDSKRMDGGGEGALVYNWSLLKRQFGHAHEVRIPPVPAHRCPYRVRARIITPKLAMSSALANEIERVCTELGVNGSIRDASGDYMMIAGGEEPAVRAAVETVVTRTHASSAEIRNWRGRMQTGFEVRMPATEVGAAGADLKSVEAPRTNVENVEAAPDLQVALVGDVLLHSNLLRRGQEAGDFTYMRQMSGIAPILQGADCTSANLESIAAGHRFGISGYPKFNAPDELLAGLAASGFDLLSVANNHMLDKGEQGLLASLDNISASGLASVGAARTKAELGRGTVIERQGVRLGFVSFTDGAKIDSSSLSEVFVNEFPGENSGVRMFRRLSGIRRQLEAMRERADVTILQLHFGEEYHRLPSAFQREFVTSLCEFDVDVIVGHHPHVLQPVEWVENSRGRHVLVAYSLGNFLSGQTGVYRQIGAVFSFSASSKLRGDRRRGERAKILEPRLLLTYADHTDDFRVRPFADVVSERPRLRSADGTLIEFGRVYDSLVGRFAEWAPDLDVR